MQKRYVAVLTGIYISSLLGLGTTQIMAADRPNDESAVPADNSQHNQLDRAVAEPTADKASNGEGDRQLMQSIRQALMKDDSLSLYAKNIKIISQQGKVTLKGTVHTENEKVTIGQKAKDLAGADKVTNRILVKGS